MSSTSNDGVGLFLFQGVAMTLREARFHKRASQLEVAFAVGMSQTKLSLIERGFVTPKRREREGIAAFLGVDPGCIQWGAMESQSTGPLQTGSGS